MIVLPALLYGTADSALGAGDDVKRIVQALRKTFSDILIRVRADSGYSNPWFYGLCERLDFEYSIDIGMNNLLKQNTEE